MAIQKSHTLSNGVSGDYWCLDTLSIKPQQLTASLVIALYKDYTYQPPIAAAITSLTIDISPEEFIRCVDMVNAKTIAEIMKFFNASLFVREGQWDRSSFKQ